MNTNNKSITDVQWYMLDKSRFYFYSCISSISSISLLYPASLITTRLQVEEVRKSKLYKGTFDAFKCIVKEEGVRGLYRGVYVSLIGNCVPGLLGSTTYELVRTELSNHGIQNDGIKSLAGGACSSLVRNLATVPGEIICQHLQMLGLGDERRKMLVNNPLNININQSKSKVAVELIQNLYLKDGLRGFYRGLGATLISRTPSVSLAWFFYYRYTSLGLSVVPIVVPYTIIELLAAMTAGVTVAILLNPLEVLRTQIQVKRQPPRQIVRNLYETEGLAAALKGVTARMIKVPVSSVFLMFAHTTVKKLSIKEEYQNKIMW